MPLNLVKPEGEYMMHPLFRHAMSLSVGLMIEGTYAGDIEMYQAHTIEPYHAHEAQVVPAIPSTPGGSATRHENKTIEMAPPAKTVQLFTPEERKKMQENDNKAGRTAKAMSKKKHSGRVTAGNTCAPHCGFDYGTGQSAPTLYNPNYNYSPYGK